jgi:hypothetical protein
MIVKPDFVDHRKTLKLIELCGGDESAPLCVVRLWAYCEINRTNTFENLPDLKLKSICTGKNSWQNHKHSCHNGRFFRRVSAATLKQILLSCRFIRQEGDTLIVHDWDVINARLIASWHNGSRGGRPPKTETHRFSSGYSPTKPKRNPIIYSTDLSTEIKEAEKNPPTREFEDFLSEEEAEANRLRVKQLFADFKKEVQAGEPPKKDIPE